MVRTPMGGMLVADVAQSLASNASARRVAVSAWAPLGSLSLIGTSPFREVVVDAARETIPPWQRMPIQPFYRPGFPWSTLRFGGVSARWVQLLESREPWTPDGWLQYCPGKSGHDSPREWCPRGIPLSSERNPSLPDPSRSNRMENEVLLLGQVVQLKSGGPPMTIVSFVGDDESEAVCTFIDSKGKVVREVFPLVALTKHNAGPPLGAMVV